MATKTQSRRSQPKPAGKPAENPRKQKSQERLARATELLSARLADGEWHSSNELHRALSKDISDALFGRAKKELAIEHRRSKGDDGRVEYQWRLVPR